jgi:hypothetical protein
MDVEGSGRGLICGICLEKEREIMKIRIISSKLEKMKQTKQM